EGEQVRADLAKAGAAVEAIVSDPSRPTTLKQRYIGLAQHRHPHQMLRVDREVRRPIDAAIEARLLAMLLPAVRQHQAVLISDYGKGVCTPRLVSQIIEAGRADGVPVIVDPSSSGDCRNYAGATAVTPNRLETKRATGIEICTTTD